MSTVLEGRRGGAPAWSGEARRLRRRWLPRFEDPALEAEFCRMDDDDALPRSRAAAALGAVIYLLFGLLDPYVLPAHAGRMIVPRAIVVGWLILVAVLIGRPRLRRVQQPLTAISVVLTGWGLPLATFFAPVPPSYLTGGTMLTAVGLFTLIGVRVRWAYPSAGLLVLGFALATIFHGGRWATAVTDALLVAGAVAFGAIAAYVLETLRRREFVNARRLAEERARSDRLLHNILPVDIAARLREDPAAIAEASDGVSVVFADLVGFTPLAERLPPRRLVELLDALFCRFDELCREHGVEKIKTIGDAYMAVAGLPEPLADHAAAAARVALGMLAVAEDFGRWPGRLELRVGISSGPVVAGVIGRDKFAYDLWGDTVNTASRMESHGHPGRVLVSAATRSLLAGRYRFTGPLQTAVKGKGALQTFLLDGEA